MVAFLVVLFASWVMSRIEHRLRAAAGGACRSRFWQGVAIGFAAITVLLGSMPLAGVFRFGAIGLRDFELYESAALWGLAFLFVGFFEEFFFPVIRFSR